MSPIEYEEFLSRVLAMSDEQKDICIRHLVPEMTTEQMDFCVKRLSDELLINELIRRFYDNKDGLERVKEVLTLPTQALP